MSAELKAQANQAAAEFAQGGDIGTFIDRLKALLAGLKNITPEEYAAIAAKIEEAAADMAAGNYFGAIMAGIQALAMIRQAMKD